MRRHLRSANERRLSLNRGKFKAGPKVADPTVKEYQFRFFDSLEDHETDDEDLLSFHGGPGEISFLPGAARSSAIAEGDTDTVSILEEENEYLVDDAMVQQESRTVLPEPSPSSDRVLANLTMTTHNSPASFDMPVSISFEPQESPTGPNGEVLHNHNYNRSRLFQTCENSGATPSFEPQPPMETGTVATNIAQDSIESSSSDERSSSETVDVSLDGETIEESSSSDVFEWIIENKAWLDLFNDFALEYTVMDRILMIINGPCKTWKTIVANVVSDMDFDSKLQVYPTCPGHVCFASLRGKNEFTACPQCGAKKPQGTQRGEGTLTYIPLLPRIASMVSNEERCKQLYAYRWQYNREEGIMHDYFDSCAFRDVCDRFGGEDNMKYDIFISASTDGVQAYKNKLCDIWPLAAILFNLPPEQRTCTKNVLPLLFIPDGKEPKDLQSFFVPFVNEMLEIYDTGGAILKFYDNVWRRVRIHLIWFTADSPAHAKVASLKGHHGKCHCRFCLVVGVYDASTKGYYTPSRFKSRNGMNVLFDPSALPERNMYSISDTLLQLENAQSNAQKDVISKESGIKGPSVLCSLPNMVPYNCFPIDTMHLFYNVQKRLLELHLGSETAEPFVLPSVAKDFLDDELAIWRHTLPAQLYTSPRPLTVYHKWKAAEHKQFTLSFYLILFDGYLPDPYLDGIHHFVQLMETCSQTSITSDDIQRAGLHAVKFFKSYEKLYMKYEESRIPYCKSVFHQLLHLKKGLELNGPLPYCSQFWVEGYAGWIVERLNAKHLAAQSMTKTAVFGEACKMFFQEPFQYSAEHADCVSSDQGFDLLGTKKLCSLGHQNVDNRRLLQNFVDYFQRKYVGLDQSNARALASSVDSYFEWPRIRFVCGNGTHTASVLPEEVLTAGDGCKGKRLSSFVAVEMDNTDSSADVYYGRLLKLIQFEIRTTGTGDHPEGPWNRTHVVAILDWAGDLCRGRQGQVFKNCALSRAFSKQTAEDVTVIRRLIGVIEHRLPRRGSMQGSRSSAASRGRTRTYFVDNHARTDHLLDSSLAAIDGINRVLRGFGEP